MSFEKVVLFLFTENSSQISFHTKGLEFVSGERHRLNLFVDLMSEFVTLAAQRRELLQTVIDVVQPEDENQSDVEEEDSIYQQLIASGRFSEILHFTPDEFDELFQAVDAEYGLRIARGAKPKHSMRGSLVVYLLLLTTRNKLRTLSFIASVAESTLQGMLRRARESLFAVLQRRWERAARSPAYLPKQPLGSPPFLRNVGLIVDSVPVQIGRPKALSFEEAKAFWSAKHKMYAMKYEVSIRSTPPYIAVFVFGGKPGAQHDFDFYKEHSKDLEAYLVQRAATGTVRWDLLADSGYLGTANHVYNRICPKKAPATVAERTRNRDISNLRYRVEQYFGKVKNFFPAIAFRYGLGLEGIDSDVKNCLWLTNELILSHGLELSTADRVFYRNSLRMPVIDAETRREAKRARDKSLYQERRRRRLESAERARDPAQRDQEPAEEDQE